MKKKLVLVAIAMTSMSLFTGCSQTKEQGFEDSSASTEIIEEHVEVKDENEVEGTQEEGEGAEVDPEVPDEQVDISVPEEMAKIEKMSLEYENADWDIPQQEMNAKAYEWYTLWDNELNVLWDNLSKTLSEDEKNALLEEQIAWIDRKDKNVIAAGIEAYGGTMQPLLEHSTAKNMTRARAYVLAECLATALGQDYKMPEEVKNKMSEVDITLDAAMENFEGTHDVSDSVTLNVMKLADSEFMADDFAEGTKWVVWYDHSTVLTEGNVYAYTKDVIVFEKEEIYYVLQKGFEGDAIILSTGSELAQMDMVGNE